MLFNSIPFLIFFPIVTLVFYLLPHKYRWIHLLAASCFFYMYFVPQYILILLITIVIDYAAGIYIEKTEGKRRKWFLVVSIVSTCLVLVIFKYLGFFHQNMISLSHYFGFSYPDRVINIILPIGLSFHTFQSLSYVIEVYRGNQKAEKHFGVYSLYVMFYPQLVTGPIERPQNLLRQLQEKKTFQLSNVVRGLRLILFGLFVKMVIADNLAVYVDQVYENPAIYNSLSLLTALLFYSFQIYCDFFGYSTIALGCALTMGYFITDNFKTPYLAKNINEFWHRWHISLSSWFRDYVYFSLGGNRVKTPRWIFNIAIVFVLSGFWHGANWTFILWGGSYAVIYLIENAFRKTIKGNFLKIRFITPIVTGFSILKNFVLVSVIWVFFRAVNVSQIKQFYASIYHNFHVKDNFSVSNTIWLFLAFFVALDVVLRKSRFDTWCGKQPFIVRWSLYAVLLFLIIAFSSVESFPFIYFQF
jgi:D-alanyl-lipoteichoic acid acyltransferase DltB (MBOAT superfamily)